MEATVSAVIDALNLRPADTLGFDNNDIEAYSPRARVLRRLIASLQRLLSLLRTAAVHFPHSNRTAIGWEILDDIHVHVTQTMVPYVPFGSPCDSSGKISKI